MADYIDRQTAIDEINKALDRETLLNSFVRKIAVEAVKKMPSADVQPVRPGRWIYGEDKHGIDGYRCNKCGFFVPWDYKHKFINYIEDYHYCPHCNARMDGEQG